MSASKQYCNYFFEPVTSSKGFIDLEKTFFKKNWLYSLDDEYIIFNVFNSKKVLVAIVGFEYTELPFQLTLQLLEVLPPYRKNKIGQIIISFGLELHKSLVPDHIRHSFMLIGSKGNARSYYKKLGANEIVNDIFYFDDDVANALIQSVKPEWTGIGLMNYLKMSDSLTLFFFQNIN